MNKRLIVASQIQSSEQVFVPSGIKEVTGVSFLHVLCCVDSEKCFPTDVLRLEFRLIGESFDIWSTLVASLGLR